MRLFVEETQKKLRDLEEAGEDTFAPLLVTVGKKYLLSLHRQA